MVRYVTEWCRRSLPEDPFTQTVLDIRNNAFLTEFGTQSGFAVNRDYVVDTT